MTTRFITFQKRVINLYIEHPDVIKIWNLLDKRRHFRKLGMEEDTD